MYIAIGILLPLILLIVILCIYYVLLAYYNTIGPQTVIPETSKESSQGWIAGRKSLISDYLCANCE